VTTTCSECAALLPLAPAALSYTANDASVHLLCSPDCLTTFWRRDNPRRDPDRYQLESDAPPPEPDPASLLGLTDPGDDPDSDD
jgi:hypothetical protein